MTPANSTLLAWAFHAALLMILFAYAGYPATMWLLSRLKPQPIRSTPFQPFVSIILAVHNEQESVLRKLDNLRALNYPAHLLEIIVVSDHSTDDTDVLVRGYPDSRVSLHVVETRLGKHYAQSIGIRAARADFLVFTDVAPLLDPAALQVMMENFADPAIGCVSGEDRVTALDGQILTEGLYIRYDMALRRWESSAGSCVGLSGAFFGVRRSLCEPWWHDRSSDLYLALRSVERGFRAISDPGALHYYSGTPDAGSEHRRKVRTIANGMVVVGHCLHLLNPLRYGRFSYQIFGHKLARWFVPLCLIAALLCATLLMRSHLYYLCATLAQYAFYTLALLGFYVPPLQRLPPIRIAVFFALSNLAVLRAGVEYLFGKTQVTWEPTRRS